MKAVILAGGKGTRLKPYTTSLPKPLMPIGERPVLELVLRQLKRYGFTEITLAVNHLSELIQAFFGDGSKWGVRICYSVEDKPLSTIGPLKILTDLPDTFLVMNGDVLTDLDLRGFWQSHKSSDAILSVATTSRETRVDFGVINYDPDLGVTGFLEKPAYLNHVSMGVYLMDRRILDYIPDGRPFGFDDLMKTLIRKKAPVRVYPYTGFWLDIGRPEDYDQANTELLPTINELIGVQAVTGEENPN